jgi:hypothetical protein
LCFKVLPGYFTRQGQIAFHGTLGSGAFMGRYSTFTPALFLAALFAGVILFGIGGERARSHAIVKSVGEAKTLAADRVHSIPAPDPHLASMIECTESGLWEERFTDVGRYRTAYNHMAFAGKTQSIEHLADMLISECAQTFVLSGGTTDEMLVRAELFEEYLPEDFRGSGLALALSFAERRLPNDRSLNGK